MKKETAAGRVERRTWCEMAKAKDLPGVAARRTGESAGQWRLN